MTLSLAISGQLAINLAGINTVSCAVCSVWTWPRENPQAASKRLPCVWSRAHKIALATARLINAVINFLRLPLSSLRSPLAAEHISHVSIAQFETQVCLVISRSVRNFVSKYEIVDREKNVCWSCVGLDFRTSISIEMSSRYEVQQARAFDQDLVRAPRILFCSQSQ